ncbi:MAG: SH3 domain-containing protein [Chloroflexi bacterium]|nr:SH3 domain-containing protein [Chloroflexota bacterium]
MKMQVLRRLSTPMMARSHPWAGVVLGLAALLLLNACSKDEATAVLDPDAALVVSGPTPTPLMTPTPTSLPVTPTAQGPGQATPTPEVTAQAGTEGPVMLTTTGNVYCRSGPAVYYKALAAFQPGVTLPVLGRTPSETGYWLVETEEGIRCWIWGKYATLSGGDPAQLPVMTPPPPPPAAFIVSVSRVSTCRGEWGLTLLIENKGQLPLESIEATIMDQAKTFEYHYPLEQSHRFLWWYDCERRGGRESIPPGEEGMITVPTNGQDLRGWPLVVRVRACTENGLQGYCFERTTLLYP